MSKTRIDFSNFLKEVLQGQIQYFYFQPPENVKIKYPCIIYGIGSGIRTPADNRKYLYTQGYEVTLITKDPDSKVVDSLLDVPMSTFERQFVSDNLYHWVFFIYF